MCNVRTFFHLSSCFIHNWCLSSLLSHPVWSWSVLTNNSFLLVQIFSGHTIYFSSFQTEIKAEIKHYDSSLSQGKTAFHSFHQLLTKEKRKIPHTSVLLKSYLCSFWLCVELSSSNINFLSKIWAYTIWPTEFLY